MKNRLILVVYALLLGFAVSVMSQERRYQIGGQVGRTTGVVARYNMGDRVAFLGEMGLKQRFAATMPKGYYNLGFSPMVSLSARWYALPSMCEAQRGVFVALDLFYEQSSLSWLYDKAKKDLYSDLNWAWGVVPTMGFEFPIYKGLNLKGSAGMVLGTEESATAIKSNSRDIHKFRNEMIFDLGVSMYF